MKNLLKISFLALITFLSIIGTSCENDDDDDNPIDNSIAGLASRTANLSILVEALNKVNLTTTLTSSGTYTVFAPTNAAFTTFLATTPYATIDDVPDAVLKEILLNHVIGSVAKSTDLSTGYIKTLGKGASSPTNTLSMFVNVGTSGVTLNGVSMVTTADIMASNGVIHIVDEVINLPTIVTHALANPNFTSLVGALTSAGQPDFVSILSGTGPFTVFAPTNNAFTALNIELAPGGIAGVSAANLTKVLRYHVVNGGILASSLTDGQIVPTLQTPQTFTIQLSNGAKIKDANNRIATITATDVQCANGVIHVLDKVLLPIL
jgi:uncharacterized surface protein with fasciclin (FAS1) repeats